MMWFSQGARHRKLAWMWKIKFSGWHSTEADFDKCLYEMSDSSFREKYMPRIMFHFYQCFYRRSIKEGANYACAKDRNCDITMETRNSCRFCRFQKCLTLGMSKEGKYCCDALSSDLLQLVIYTLWKSETLKDFNLKEEHEVHMLVLSICLKFNSLHVYGRNYRHLQCQTQKE